VEGASRGEHREDRLHRLARELQGWDEAARNRFSKLIPRHIEKDNSFDDTLMNRRMNNAGK
jgi:hypothetical protein